MKTLIRLLFFLILLTFFTNGCNNAQLSSPDGRIVLNFSIEQGVPKYEILFDENLIVDKSPMGYKLKNQQGLDENLAIEAIEKGSFDGVWQPVWGQFNVIRENYNELLVRLKESSGQYRQLNIIFRVFDDGVGFRYEIPTQPNLSTLEITSEETRFNLIGNHSSWWIPANPDGYEQLYSNTSLDEVIAVNTPITFETNTDTLILIHEAALTDYPGMALLKVSDCPYCLKSELIPWPDGTKVKAETPMLSPWRVLLMVDGPEGLIESTTILNLNEPSRIDNTSWIKPMKYIGIWWGMHLGIMTWEMGMNHGATTERSRQYIDFASENGIDGVLIEGWNKGWENWGQPDAFSFVEAYPDFDLDEVAAYADEMGVTLIGHHETGGDIPNYEKQMEEAFKLYNSLGIHTVKTGYVGAIRPEGQHHHGQFMVTHYRKVVETAAKYKITVNVHEPIKPTGIGRTWPNMMTREGARGMEHNAWSEGNPPEHTCVLPFTRLIAGPMDYTPGIFDLLFENSRERNLLRSTDDVPFRRVHTTLAKQLALYVILYSPIQMAADLPENYEGHPAFEFIREVPVIWDETLALDGKIGDYVAIARRKGENWYIGSITDETARNLEVNLSFLIPDQIYQATIYRDADNTDWETNPLSWEFKEKFVSSLDVMTIEMKAGGGQAIILKPVN
jgi:alpha-glucosidase